MHLLAFDTSTETMSIAVQRGDAVWEHTGPGGPQASTGLIAGIQTLLAQAGLELGQLDALVFGQGPGSFTGLRTACAVAQGLAYGAGGGRGVPVLALDTLSAVAQAALQNHACTEVVAVLDARMDEVYTAQYRWAAGQWHAASAVALCAPEALVVPAGWTVAGNAQAVYGERLAPGANHVFALPTARALLQLAPAALAAGHASSAHHAMPLYIRDKVAQTTAERAAKSAAQSAAQRAGAAP